MPASAARNFSRRCCARGLGEVRWDRRARGRAQLFVEQLAHLLLLQVDGGHDDVGRRLAAELHDALAEVGVHHLDAARLEVLVEAALLGEHRLALHQPRDARAAQDPVHDRLCSSASRAQCTCAPAARAFALELLQLVGQPRERVRLDLRRPGRAAPPIPGTKRRRRRACCARTRPPGRASARAPRRRRTASALGVWSSACRSARQISATWSDARAAVAPAQSPSRCMRQHMSVAAMNSAPARS